VAVGGVPCRPQYGTCSMWDCEADFAKGRWREGLHCIMHMTTAAMLSLSRLTLILPRHMLSVPRDESTHTSWEPLMLMSNVPDRLLARAPSVDHSLTSRFRPQNATNVSTSA
jgi:hypothetical protein